MNIFLNQLLEQRNTMARSFYQILAASALVVSMATGAYAQTTEAPDHNHDHAVGTSNIVCGPILFNDGKEKEALANTARNNPELYQRMLERTKQNPNRYIQSDGEFYNTFLVRNRVSGDFEEVLAVLKFMGRRARIWVDVRDTTRVKPTVINQLARGLDSTTGTKSRNKEKGIIENDEEVFGLPPINRFDNATPLVQDFLFTDIKDNLNTGFVAGFFSPYDQTNGPGSNNMNILYIDSKEGLQQGVVEILSTLAHEYQHLIHYNTNNQSEVLFNEGCSEVASILNGYASRGNAGFLSNTNVPMFGWNHDDGSKLLKDYERALTFVHYLYEQYGEDYITALNRTKTRGMARVNDALRSIGNNDDWKDILSAWAAANYVKTFNAPYGYKSKLSNANPALLGNYTTAGTFPASGEVDLMQYGSAYNSYTKPGPIKVTFHSNRAIRVMAMLYQGTTPVEVWTIEKETPTTIGSYATYDKVVFAIVNLDNGGQNVSWDIEKITLGVEDQVATSGGLAVTSISPNPTVGSTTVGFTVPAAGEATVQIYDSRGSLVRTLVDGERFEAGSHQLPVSTEGLATGAYMVRVSQGSKSASHVMVVMR